MSKKMYRVLCKGLETWVAALNSLVNPDLEEVWSIKMYQAQTSWLHKSMVVVSTASDFRWSRGVDVGNIPFRRWRLTSNAHKPF
jgi:hypothetical protein